MGHVTNLEAIQAQAAREAEAARIEALPFRDRLDLIVERLAREAQERLDKTAADL